MKITIKEKIIKALINGLIGTLTSIATIYLGASAAEAVTAGGVTTGAIGERVSSAVMSLFSEGT